MAGTSISKFRLRMPKHAMSVPKETRTMSWSCFTSKTIRINAVANVTLARRWLGARLLKPVAIRPGGIAFLPQHMYVWPGLKLQACVKQQETNNVNGFEYEVLNTTGRMVKLRQLHPAGKASKHGQPFERQHEETASRLILQHALCCYTAQGHTLRDGPVVCTATDQPVPCGT